MFESSVQKRHDRSVVDPAIRSVSPGTAAHVSGRPGTQLTRIFQLVSDYNLSTDRFQVMCYEGKSPSR